MPNCFAVFGSACGGRPTAIWENVVLHECANADVSGTVPRSKLSSLWMTVPSIVVVPGQGCGVAGVRFVPWNAAVAVTILNVEPGGYRPVSGLSPAVIAAVFAAIARMWPVDGWIT